MGVTGLKEWRDGNREINETCSFSPSCRPAPLTRKTAKHTSKEQRYVDVHAHQLGTSPHPGDILFKSKTFTQWTVQGLGKDALKG